MNALLKTIRYLLSVLYICAGGMLGSVFGQEISGISPLNISAGTGSELVIEGSGFGNGPFGPQFYVEFPEADHGGIFNFSPAATEYISWSDTRIVVRVPSGAGTGYVRVNNSGLVLTSPQELTISYSITNAGDESKRHIGRNSTGGYTFRYESSFNANTQVRNSFNKSLKTWACIAGMNWSAGEPTTVNSAGKDGVNVVRFDTDAELPAGVLGVTYTYSARCSNSSDWEIEEIDLVFDRETDWNFGEDIPDPSLYDFQSVALHELGHAHNLGHVIGPDDPMHYAIGPGTARRELSDGNRDAALFQMEFSETPPTGACSVPIVPVFPESCPFPFPIINAVSPMQAGKDETVMISGKYLAGTTLVSFGGTSAASFRIISDELIEATPGTGFTGEISVTTPGGIFYLGGFTFLEDPVLFSFSPAFGYTGDKIIIAGNHLQTAGSVSFGGIPAASYEVINNQTIEAVLGGGATGDIVVTTDRGAAAIAGFTFTPGISISSVSPAEGIEGDIITIRGSNFKDISSVKFGNTDAAEFWLESENEIKAVLGKGNRGRILISSPFGNASFNGFSFILAPQVSKFTPSGAASGAAVTIKGENFLNAEAVFFGSEPALSFTVKDTASIIAVVGEGASGPVSVKTRGGTGSRDGFTFIETLAIRDFTPKSAATNNVVTITGKKFRKVIGVSFGGVPARSFTVDSPESISAVVGSGATGDVTVRTGDGTVSSPGFKFVLPPDLSFFTPSSAGAGGIVSLSGTNLSQITSVKFGGVEAASFHVISDTYIEAVAGNGASGKISVTNAAGTAEVGPFIFIQPPVIERTDPVTAGEGTSVDVFGQNLSTAREVVAGDLAVASFQVVSATQLNIIIAKGASGRGIKISTAGGTAVYDKFRIIQLPVIQSFSPHNAIAGTEVTISGQNLDDVTAVSFGGIPASSFRILSASQLAAVVSPGSRSGTITLSNAAGTVEADGFIFKLTLPSDNFRILTTDLTCKGSMNGMIRVSAHEPLGYRVTLTYKGASTTYAFSDVAEFKNLAAGSYSVCIKIDGESGFEQCFESVLKEPEDLAVYSYIDRDKNTVNLRLEGGTTYFIELNDKLIKTTRNETDLDLLPGNNTLKVYTDKLCQGVVERILSMNTLSVFPNPFDSDLNIFTSLEDNEIAAVEISDMNGRVVLSERKATVNGGLKLNLSDLSAGSYLIRISGKNYRSVNKILKK